MHLIQKETLSRVLQELSCHPCGDAELEELVAPQMGIISGFQDLLTELEQLRVLQLGELPPAGQVQPSKKPEE
ncbi:MAG: hypothetical protein V7731_19935 [Amphritea sp.]